MKTDFNIRDKPRRIGLVEGHLDIIRDYLSATVSNCPDLEIAMGAETVPQLLQRTTQLDLVVLDLAHLPDKSTPADNVMALQNAGISNTIVLTLGDDRRLVQQAAKAGVLSIVLKKASRDVLVEALRAGVIGDPMPTADWAASIDHDPHAPEWKPQERVIIELFASGLLAADISAILKITGPELTAEIRSIIKKYRNADSKIPQLSPKEREVFRLYAYGQGAKGIAQSLGITNNTVWTHIKKVKYKYERVGRPCNTRSEMRQNAIADGIIPEP